MSSRIIDAGDLLTLAGAVLLGAGLWAYVGAAVLVAYGAVLLAVGLWLSWRARPRRKP